MPGAQVVVQVVVLTLLTHPLLAVVRAVGTQVQVAIYGPDTVMAVVAVVVVAVVVGVIIVVVVGVIVGLIGVKVAVVVALGDIVA